MWKVLLQKSIKEVRIVAKQAPEYHSLQYVFLISWIVTIKLIFTKYCICISSHFATQRIPELRMLSPNTFYSFMNIDDGMESASCIDFHFGDCKYKLYHLWHSHLPNFQTVNDTIHRVNAAGVSYEAWEQVDL